MLCNTQVLIPDDDDGVTVLDGDIVGDGFVGNSSVSLAKTVHSAYPLTVPARTPNI